jgi:hypothetical protein
MPVFSYYKKLSAADRKIYRASDGIHGITLPRSEELCPLVPRLARALEQEDREKVELLCRKLAAGMTERLGVPPLRVRVLAARPSASWGELHGLYEPLQGRAFAVITLWMRTAKQKRVVAFKAFLRTLLHEFCHHLDYELFRLADSYHTEGFYRRESSLFHQLVPDEHMPMSARRSQTRK